ncbi:TAXI family TRAP transporter solute-binding subunit [Kaistia terrae]|uniref:TAXI family TRAP transporter solute-binding subunit n=1 Tax=Kaistia terrae TaxID=537017 RepID=A0ABW0PTD5_9HYPH|nr:TAXI family TRAP transporter solute-binding subunit [Kaistia terrae]MCX5577372.1 TAXI family TRAP transporter solute-binding subunit [Kaistia terrae]
MSDFSFNRRQLLTIGTGIAAMVALPAPGFALSPTHPVIATGGKGGVFYPYGKAIADVLAGTVEVTGGSVDNARLVHSGKAAIGFSTLDSAYDAVHGVGAYATDGKLDLRVLAVLYDSFLHVVANADAGIATIADLKGKRVSIGSAGSSTESIADRVLQAAGLDPANGVVRSNLGVAESAEALKDGKIDAFFWIGGVPTAAVRELSEGKPALTFIATGGEYAAIDQKYPGLYRQLVLPKSAYAGLKADVPSLGVANILTVSAKAEDAFVTATLNGIFDNLGAIHKSHPEAAKLALTSAGVATAVPFHPAAEAFYKAKGD